MPTPNQRRIGGTSWSSKDDLAEITKAPAGEKPPYILKRTSSRRYSEEERGGIYESDLDLQTSFSSMEESSPDPNRRLFKQITAGSFYQRLNGVLQICLLIALVIISVWAWMPVFRYAMGSRPTNNRIGATQISAGVSSIDAQGVVLLYHEPGCLEESIELTQSNDLCALQYPSKMDVKDNVASVRLLTNDSPNIEVLVYGTCAGKEQPTNPMLLEIVRNQGCTDLKYPICGRLELRRADWESPSYRGDVELR